MGQDVRQIINIIGIALFVGIVVRYSSAVQGLVSTSTSGFKTVYETVSLQNVALPTSQSTGPNWGR